MGGVADTVGMLLLLLLLVYGLHFELQGSAHSCFLQKTISGSCLVPGLTFTWRAPLFAAVSGLVWFGLVY